MSERTDEKPLSPCDLLAAYELGLLDGQERLRFEGHLETCPHCLEEVYAFAPASLLLTAAPGRFAALAAPAKPSVSGRLAAVLAGIFQPRVFAPVAAAAALALLVLIPSAPRWSDLAVVEPLSWSHVQVRAGGDPGGRLFADGMERYTAGRYDDAAEILQQAARAMEDTDRGSLPLQAGTPGQARLYAGVSLLLAGRPQAAKGPLLAAAANPLPPVAQGADWYLAQAYLLTDRPDSAGMVLKGLAESPVYGSRARALLDRLAR